MYLKYILRPIYDMISSMYIIKDPNSNILDFSVFQFHMHIDPLTGGNRFRKTCIKRRK